MDGEASGSKGAAPMALWKRLWILFTVIWVVVGLLNVVTLIALADKPPYEKLTPMLLFTFGVPAVLYLAGWARQRWRSRNESGKGDSST